METPSSTRRITRSQTKHVLSNITNLSSRKTEESEKNCAKPKQRSCMIDIDITNDSPIIGLTSKSTPISSISKKNKTSRCMKTPSSGEALLRSQVKNLLQKVEEETDEISKFLSFDTVVGHHGVFQGFLNSPMSLLAPTPANTPQALDFNYDFDDFESMKSETKMLIETDTDKDIVSRSLFMDFSDKSDCSSVITIERQDQLESPLKEEDDVVSIWSIQVNASRCKGDKYAEVEECEAKSDNSEIDELCERKEMKYMGKHIRLTPCSQRRTSSLSG